ncbi:MAG TPA: L-threonine 3-dehydrogenase [Acidimicrobiia bacterium]|nr:L-threonine 3-dehydrogenase [Acidimicrobiia bacterium]
MKALVKAKAEPGLWMEEVERPEPGDRDVLIRVHKASICGTDLHILRWDQWAQATIPVPLVVGHEFMGEVAALGAEVKGLAVGQRVSGEGHITCGHCRNCLGGRRHFCHNHVSVGVTRAGAFAEYLVIPAENVFPLPDHITDDIASVLDPLGNAAHTALAFDVIGEDVLVTGAGPIGMMATAISRHIGARFVVVSDVNPYRLALAERMGADEVVDVRSEEIRPVMDGLGMTEGFDVGMEMSGSERAFNQMLGVMNHGGRVAVLGIPPAEVTLDLDAVIFKGLTVQGIYGRRIFETWYKTAAMLQSGLDVSPVITHRFEFDDFQTAFEVVASRDCGKVVLEW